MKQSDCESVQNLLSLYIDNMLSEEESNIVREHIKSCASCREELALMQSILKETKNLPEIEVSADFHKNLMEKIKAEGKPEKKFAVNWKQAAGFVAAAAVVALSVVSFIELDRTPDNQNIDTYLASPTPQAEHIEKESAEPNEEQKKASEETENPAKKTTAAEKTVQPEQANKTDKPSVREDIVADDTAGHSPFAVARSMETDGIAAHSDDSNEETSSEYGIPAAAETQPASEASAAPGNSAKSVSEKTTASEKDKGAEAKPSTNTKASGGSSGGGGGAASGGAARPKVSTFRIATVTVSENAKVEAIAILSAYAKDANGYKVGESLQTVLNQLSALEGYSISTKNANHVSANYIVLK